MAPRVRGLLLSRGVRQVGVDNPSRQRGRLCSHGFSHFQEGSIVFLLEADLHDVRSGSPDALFSSGPLPGAAARHGAPHLYSFLRASRI